MSTPLLDRLRANDLLRQDEEYVLVPLCREAADEIERLQAVVRTDKRAALVETATDMKDMAQACLSGLQRFVVRDPYEYADTIADLKRLNDLVDRFERIQIGGIKL